MVQSCRAAYPQREIADASYELQREIGAGRRIVVGVNGYIEGDDGHFDSRVDPTLEKEQIAA